MTLVNCKPDLMNLSFSGCGFLCVYHAGVAAAVKEYAPQLLQNKILGASAGSIVACGLITNVCISHATSTILKVVTQARSRMFGPLHPEFDLLGIVREELERILPPNAYEMCTDRLIISLTRYADQQNVIVEEYRSNADLIDAIICSCFIPGYCGFTAPKFRGVEYIDGGVSDNQPIYDDHTLTVSPFSGESDICPPDWDTGSPLGLDFNGTSIRFTSRNMFRLMACLWPRSTEDLSKMCLQGFGDALRFLTKNGLAPCIRCLTIQTIDANAGRASSECFSECDEVLKPNPLSAVPSMNRIKKRSSTNALNGYRTRIESECETCGDSDIPIEDVNVHSFFPSIMRKPFDDAVAAEKSLFSYVMSFRLVRYAALATGLSKFPLDVAMAFVRKFVIPQADVPFITAFFARVYQYLDMMSPPQWILNKLRNLADFILGEVEKQKSRFTNFSCLVAVTETEKFGSALATMDKDESKEIELSEEAKKEMRLLRERDRRRKVLKRAGKITPNNSESSLPPDAYDVDSFEHVIDFTRNHEALYEFHYLDENKVMRTYGLFTDHTNPSSPLSLGSASSRLVHVPEEDEETVSSTQPTFEGGDVVELEESDDKDSGLSGIDTKRNNRTGGGEEAAPTTSKRDACCSPVFDQNQVSEASSSSPRRSEKTRGSARRYAGVRGAAVTTSSAMSSDSEGVDGTEKLFVPSRKAWRASSEFDAKECSPKPASSDTTA